jgi:peptidoglycan/LPS O-acetylase OafA/YrhL
MNTSNIPLAPADSKDGRDFEKLVMWVCSLSIGAMAGFLASLKQVNPAIQIRFSVATVIAFVAGGILTALFLRVVLRAEKRRRTLLVVAAAIVCVLGYFLIGIKDTSHENRSDVTIGTVAAVIVLSGVAFVIWRVGKFFESDTPPDQNNG